jgi:hypothetical protein
MADIQIDKRYIVTKLQLPPIMFTFNRISPFLVMSLTLAAPVIFISPTSGYFTRDVELLLTDDSIMVPTATAMSGSSEYDDGDGNGEGNGNSNDGETIELTEPTEATEPSTAQTQFSPPLKTPTLPTAPSSTAPEVPTPTLTLGSTFILTSLQHPRTIITNVNNVNINNVQNYEGAVRGTPDCAPLAATIMLGPSTMEDGGARVLAAFDPCVLSDGTMLLNLPDEQGIQLVAANIQGGQTTQSAIIPLQRIAPVTQGQVLFGADLNGQVTGPDQARGESATLNGNINALFLWNNSGEAVEFIEDNSVALDILIRR